MVNGTQAALPYLERSNGTLITVASIAADIPTPLLGVYAASKRAVKAYIESLRIELTIAQSSVNVSLIKPSGIDTPIGQHARNHTDAEALIPPPVYDPTIVAEAILGMVESPRREITIGGVGRLNVLLGEHFPRALEHLSRYFRPLLTDPTKPPTPDDNLHHAGDDGRVRSGTEHGRGFSGYTSVVRHRGLATVAAAALAAIPIALRCAEPVAPPNGASWRPDPRKPVPRPDSPRIAPWPLPAEIAWV